MGSAGTRWLDNVVAATTKTTGIARQQVSRSVIKGASCAIRAHSFSKATLVATAAGAIAIGSLAVGDHVLAYDEATGQTASYPISVVHVNDDPVTGTVVVAGEAIETTPEHPFYTLEQGWLDAEDLEPGMRVPSASGEPGVVESVDFSAAPAIMYNLTVEVAHTYFVGEGEWLVHNVACPYSRPSGYRAGVRDQVWEANINPRSKRVHDPGTGQFMSKNRAWDMGHKPGFEFRHHAASARHRGLDRRQFLDEHNDPAHYRPELPRTNRSRKLEQSTPARQWKILLL